MKTANVADLRNNFRRISEWIEEGEKVRILKRGKPFAVLTRAEPEEPGQPNRVDWRGQLDEIWGERVFSAEEVARMRADELEGEEG
jgi:antitoxin (DNA-binding transcriptional repressor) of toxin-antitoxin stability system